MDLRLCLLRHGSTAWTAERRYCGHADVPLDPAGRAQIDDLARSSGPGGAFDRAYTSDLWRCRETATRLGLVARPVAALRELDFGDLEGRRWHDLTAAEQAALVDPETFVAPGGESVASLRERVDTFVAQLPAGRHLLVTHGGVIQHLLHRASLVAHIGPGQWIDLVFNRR